MSCGVRLFSLPVHAVSLLVLVPGAAAWGDGWGKPQLFLGSTDVAELQPEEFEDRVITAPTKRAWVVVFYAHWCGHCKHFAPIWKKVASLYKKDDRLRFGGLDCAKYSSFCGKLGVKSFPTLRGYHFPDMKGSEALRGADVDKVFDANQMKDRLDPHVKQLPAVEAAIPQLPNLAPKNVGAIDSDPSPDVIAKAVEQSAAMPKLAAAAVAANQGITRTTIENGLAAAAMTNAGRSQAELRLVDAEVAIVYSLRQGAYLAAEEATTLAPQPSNAHLASSHATISGEKLWELVAWLDFLAAVFPSRKASQSLRALAGLARQQRDTSGVLDRDAWVKTLESQVIDRVAPSAGEDPSPHWRLCHTYTCGLWTLFHLVLITVAETSTGVAFLAPATGGAGVPRAAQVLARIRGFVAHFFGCEDCVKHFLDTYDSCKYGRCQLSPSDGRGAALWLWRVHNVVTRRVSRGRDPKAPVAPLWPSRSDCALCWPPASAPSGYKPYWANTSLEAGEDRFDGIAVYTHLRLSFWRAEWAVGGRTFLPATDVALQVSALLLSGLCLAYLVYLLTRGRRSSRQMKKGC